MTVPAQGQEKHVGRGVDRPQASVHVEWVRRERLLESLGRDDLKGVAADDVLARGVDHGVELTLGHIRLPARAVDSVPWRRQRIGFATYEASSAATARCARTPPTITSKGSSGT